VDYLSSQKVTNKLFVLYIFVVILRFSKSGKWPILAVSSFPSFPLVCVQCQSVFSQKQVQNFPILPQIAFLGKMGKFFDVRERK